MSSSGQSQLLGCWQLSSYFPHTALQAAFLSELWPLFFYSPGCIFSHSSWLSLSGVPSPFFSCGFVTTLSHRGAPNVLARVDGGMTRHQVHAAERDLMACTALAEATQKTLHSNLMGSDLVTSQLIHQYLPAYVLFRDWLVSVLCSQIPPPIFYHSSSPPHCLWMLIL